MKGPGAAWRFLRQRTAQQFGAVMGVLILAVSVLGALATWRASVWSATATDLDQQAAQETLLATQVDISERGVVAFERRLFADFEGHVRSARAYRREAARPDRETEAVQRLAANAQDELAMADAVRLLFLSASPYRVDRAGPLPFDRENAVAYDPREALARAAIFRGFLERDLAPRELRITASTAHRETVVRVLVYTVLIGAIVLFTLAQIVGRRRGRVLAIVGVAVSVLATMTFTVLEVIAL